MKAQGPSPETPPEVELLEGLPFGTGGGRPLHLDSGQAPTRAGPRPAVVFLSMAAAGKAPIAPTAGRFILLLACTCFAGGEHRLPPE